MHILFLLGLLLSQAMAVAVIPEQAFPPRFAEGPGAVVLKSTGLAGGNSTHTVATLALVDRTLGNATLTDLYNITADSEVLGSATRTLRVHRGAAGPEPAAPRLEVEFALQIDKNIAEASEERTGPLHICKVTLAAPGASAESTESRIVAEAPGAVWTVAEPLHVSPGLVRQQPDIAVFDEQGALYLSIFPVPSDTIRVSFDGALTEESGLLRAGELDLMIVPAARAFTGVVE